VPGEELRAKLIVPDTGPLINLAAADSLDYLLYPGVPVCVPDAVLYEATVRGDALGAQSIAEWAQGHSQQVFPLVTQTFADHLAMLEAGLKTPRDLGERAAIEAIRHTLVLGKDERAIFITEDDRLLTGTYVVLDQDRDRMISITTWGFLEGSKKRIASIRQKKSTGERKMRAVWQVVVPRLPLLASGRLLPSRTCCAGRVRSRRSDEARVPYARNPSKII
jgi:hypothetical protein